MPDVLVETDFHQWALDTADAIQKRQFTHIDWDRVAEEIHSRANRKNARSSRGSHRSCITY